MSFPIARIAQPVLCVTILEFLNRIVSSALLDIIARKVPNPQPNANLDLIDHHLVLHQEVLAIRAQEALNAPNEEL